MESVLGEGVKIWEEGSWYMTGCGKIKHGGKSGMFNKKVRDAWYQIEGKKQHAFIYIYNDDFTVNIAQTRLQYSNLHLQHSN